MRKIFFDIETKNVFQDVGKNDPLFSIYRLLNLRFRDQILFFIFRARARQTLADY